MRRLRPGSRILAYHRFGPVSFFGQQCAHIKKCYFPLSLTELTLRLRDSQAFPSGAIAITVDDGYRDFLEIAFPILQRYGIPVTVFLTTDLPDRDGWLWVDQVSWCLEKTRAAEVRLQMDGREEQTWPLEPENNRKNSAYAIKEKLKKIPNARRIEILENLPGLLAVELPSKAPEAYRPLTWDDVRFLARRGVEFGAHTRTHPILSRLSSREELECEIAESKNRIEQETGTTVDHFCYPNGTSADFSKEAVEVIKACGFSTAVTGNPGINFRGDDPYLLRRIAVEPDWEERFFSRRVAGHRIPIR